MQYDINRLLDEIIESRFFESDYTSLTEKLLYEDFSYDKAILNGINEIKKLKMF